MQHGASRPPRHAEGHALVPHDQLQRLMSEASAVVTHGGPATIVEARRHGKRPLVVPRDHRLGEHVDGHQLRFARRLADEGLIVLCEQRDELTAALDAARRDPDNLTLVGGAQPGAAEERVAAAVARVGGIVDELVASSRRGELRGLRRSR